MGCGGRLGELVGLGAGYLSGFLGRGRGLFRFLGRQRGVIIGGHGLRLPVGFGALQPVERAIAYLARKSFRSARRPRLSTLTR